MAKAPGIFPRAGFWPFDCRYIYLRGGRGQEAALSLPSAGNPLSGKAGKLRESRGESISFFTPPFPYYLIRFLLFDICALMNFNAFISFKGLCLFLLFPFLFFFLLNY